MQDAGCIQSKRQGAEDVSIADFGMRILDFVKAKGSSQAAMKARIAGLNNKGGIRITDIFLR